MVDFFRCVVVNIEKLVVFIKKPSCIFTNVNNGALGFGILVLSFLVGQKLQMIVMSKVIANVAGTYLCVIIYLGAFDKYLRVFSHGSYTSGIIFLAGFTTVMLWRFLNFNIENFFTVLSVNLSIYSVWWFCYHIVAEKIALKLIKVRVRFYLGMGGLVSYVLLLANINIQLLSIMVASFLLSFAWISYFIEAFEHDKECKEAS